MLQNGERLKGKVAVVTGAGSRGEVVGIGSATAILFAKQGASVLVVDKDEENAKRTLSQIIEEGGEASLYVADVTYSSACQRMVEAAVSRYGGLHILFNNAGITDRKSVVEVEENSWETCRGCQSKRHHAGMQTRHPANDSEWRRVDNQYLFYRRNAHGVAA